MIVQHYTQDAYLIGNHMVVLECLANDRNGTPRYKGFVVSLDNAKASPFGNTGAFTYVAKGFFKSNEECAKIILDEHLAR